MILLYFVDNTVYDTLHGVRPASPTTCRMFCSFQPASVSKKSQYLRIARPIVRYDDTAEVVSFWRQC